MSLTEAFLAAIQNVSKTEKNVTKVAKTVKKQE